MLNNSVIKDGDIVFEFLQRLTIHHEEEKTLHDSDLFAKKEGQHMETIPIKSVLKLMH